MDYLSWQLQWNSKHSSLSIAHFIYWENYRLDPSEVEIKWIKNRASTSWLKNTREKKEDFGSCPTKAIQGVSNSNKSVLANEKETRTFQSTHANISIRRVTQPLLKIRKSYERFLKQRLKAFEEHQRRVQCSWGSGGQVGGEGSVGGDERCESTSESRAEP